jgi:hypothetical protein
MIRFLEFFLGANAPTDGALDERLVLVAVAVLFAVMAWKTS